MLPLSHNIQYFHQFFLIDRLGLVGTFRALLIEIIGLLSCISTAVLLVSISIVTGFRKIREPQDWSRYLGFLRILKCLGHFLIPAKDILFEQISKRLASLAIMTNELAVISRKSKEPP